LECGNLRYCACGEIARADRGGVCEDCRARRKSKYDLILDYRAEHPRESGAEIAARVDCTESYVYQVLAMVSNTSRQRQSAKRIDTRARTVV
jgi:hypothetical protein